MISRTDPNPARASDTSMPIAEPFSVKEQAPRQSLSTDSSATRQSNMSSMAAALSGRTCIPHAPSRAWAMRPVAPCSQPRSSRVCVPCRASSGPDERNALQSKLEALKQDPQVEVMGGGLVTLWRGIQNSFNTATSLRCHSLRSCPWTDAAAAEPGPRSPAEPRDPGPDGRHDADHAEPPVHCQDGGAEGVGLLCGGLVSIDVTRNPPQCL